LSLLDRAWPDPVSALLTLHVREPESERQIRDSIPRLTAIDDAVSLAVQRQYEENPYPRWLNFAPVVAFASRDDDVAGAILPQGVEQFMRRGITDMLVAGCGTGQQAIEVARAYSGAQVLAIDLSLASLAYAKRMTKASGARNVEYAQADILKLASIGRTFDGIFAAGVLHHLADPFAGWRVLRTLLRSGGIMDVALYSELGRRRIVAGQQFVQDGSYSASAADIRRFRDDVMAQGHGVLFDTMTRIGDFFSVSECRDLLFHVQEQRFTLPEIARFLADNNLRFLGFRLSPSVGRQYRTRFPRDENLTDLTSWQLFEADNPDTFIGMYQFLVQDIG
jgi:2-polyprenyl-3-methyl-5-hydroxy-6-metoxy-1,4-benzoquinol methylase